MNARSYPTEENLEQLCIVLGTTEEELNGLRDSSFEEKLQYDQKFTKAILNGYQDFNNGIGLDESFLRFVRKEIKDEEFPLNTQIVLNTKTDQYERIIPTEAYEIKSNSLYQLSIENGKTINLSYADFAFLKDVQTEVVKYIEYLYYKRRKEIDDSIQSINDEYAEYNDSDNNFRIEDIVMKYDKYYEYETGKQLQIIYKQKKEGK